MLGREIHVKHPLFGWGVKNQNWPQRTKDFKRDERGSTPRMATTVDEANRDRILIGVPVLPANYK